MGLRGGRDLSVLGTRMLVDPRPGSDWYADWNGQFMCQHRHFVTFSDMSLNFERTIEAMETKQQVSAINEHAYKHAHTHATHARTRSQVHAPK
jgi:hypothetical protein